MFVSEDFYATVEPESVPGRFRVTLYGPAGAMPVVMEGLLRAEADHIAKRWSEDGPTLMADD